MICGERDISLPSQLSLRVAARVPRMSPIRYTAVDGVLTCVRADVRAWKRMILTIFLLIAVRACFAQAPPAFPDNILTPAGDVGLPPAISTEGDSETVNLTNGSLNMFIPALTLRQRSGTRPLVLGFTYNSNQWIIRQDVSVTLFSSELSSSDEGCSGFYCALATNYVPYDYDSYTELVEPSTP